MMGIHEDLDFNRGATAEAIDALVAYKFQSKKFQDGEAGEDNGGVLAAGTDKERTISAEDAVSVLLHSCLHFTKPGIYYAHVYTSVACFHICN
jgi:hypothetical protein